MPWFHWQGESLFLQMHVQPGARNNCFVGLHGDRLKVKINAPPVDGKANIALIDFLARCFETSKSAISVQQGALSRDKTLCIANVHRIPAELAALGLSDVH